MKFLKIFILFLLLLTSGHCFSESNSSPKKKQNENLQKFTNLVISLTATNFILKCNADTDSLNSAFYETLKSSKTGLNEQQTSRLIENVKAATLKLIDSPEFQERVNDKPCTEVVKTVDDMNRHLTVTIPNTVQKAKEKLISILNQVDKGLVLMIAGDDLLGCGIDFNLTKDKYSEFLEKLNIEDQTHLRKVFHHSKRLTQDSNTKERMLEKYSCEYLEKKNVELISKLNKLISQ